MVSLRWMRTCALKLAAALFGGGAGALALALAAQAQGLVSPALSITDERGVNLATGQFTLSAADILIGQPGSGLSYTRIYDGTWRNNHQGIITKATNESETFDYFTIRLGTNLESFTAVHNQTNFLSDQSNGSSLSFSGSVYSLVTSDGTVASFSQYLGNLYEIENGWYMEARLTSLLRPSGERLTYHYKDGDAWNSRLQSVTSNLGYQIHIQYQSDTLPSSTWNIPYRVTGINNAVDYCAPLADVCAGLSVAWPYAQYTASSVGGKLLYHTITDPLGRQVSHTYSGNIMTGVRAPSSSADDLTIAYEYVDFFGVLLWRVASVTREGVGTWNYDTEVLSPADGVRYIVTNPLGQTRSVRTRSWRGFLEQVVSDTNGFGQATSYDYDSYGRVTRVTLPEGNYTQYAYDGRGNLTQVVQVPKSGSGLANITTTASYDGTCTYPAKCNHPNSVTDTRGFRTDYTYDTAHGGVLTATAPAPSGSPPVGSGTRPQPRFTYTSLYAWYKNSAGVVVQGPSPVTFLASTSACATTSSCSGGSDETVTEMSYGSIGVANNRLPAFVTTRAGNSSIIATTSTTYDAFGNVKMVDGPQSGNADTTRYYYDAARQITGVIGPDPDAGGALKHRAARTSYNADGQPTVVELGATTNQGDTAFSTFVVSEKQETVYDGAGQPVQTRLWNGGTIVALTQMNYNTSGRPLCVAVRMDPAATPPASACWLGTANDRINWFEYDAAGRPSFIWSGLGTPSQQRTYRYYSPNGLVWSTFEPDGNRTCYSYDGHDRPTYILYPVPGAPDPNFTTSQCSSTDYDYISYGNTPTYLNELHRVNWERRRNGQWIYSLNDNLGRLIFRDTPDLDITTSYDLFSRVVSTSTSGSTVGYLYDQLSRVTRQSETTGNTDYVYDIAGRRTRMTWPGGGFYVDYIYNAADDLTQIRENGATSGLGLLAQFAYDDLGRRTSLTRGNGIVTSYTFDAISRLATLTQNAAGTSHDNTLTVSYNPASQITSRTRTNAVYDWTSPGSSGTTTTSYSDNGLNQYTMVGSVAPAYDTNGNLINDGSRTFGYNQDNQLRSASGGVALDYDPLGRLRRLVGSSTTRFAYDGSDMIAELNSSASATLRRYVHGPGMDEPLVWYEGSGTSDRRWLLADERGSIVGVANDSGTVTSVNSYDASGQPAAGNVGRFGYTGQTWIAEAGVWHFKARAYHPGLGRFLQTDPIGIAGGMNLYGYAGNDPINAMDPSGLAPHCNVVNQGSPVADGPNHATQYYMEFCSYSELLFDPAWCDLYCPGNIWPDHSAPPVQPVAPQGAWICAPDEVMGASCSWYEGMSQSTADELNGMTRETLFVGGISSLGGGLIGSGGRALFARLFGGAVSGELTAASSITLREALRATGKTAPQLQRIVGWGSGPEGVAARVGTVTRAEVASMRRAGLTREMVQGLRDGYINAHNAREGLGVSMPRARLLQEILNKW